MVETSALNPARNWSLATIASECSDGYPRVVEAVRGPDELRELCPPLVGREVLGVGVPRPDALEDHLVLGLVARAARLDLLKNMNWSQ